jgi:ketosteroid isomerase-like protein
MAQEVDANRLYELHQEIYYDNIDAGDADAAVEALHPDVEWIHTQVWEHDGHYSEATDILHGREAVREFLAERVPELEEVDIRHQVGKTVADGEQGAFHGQVVGPDGDTRKMIAWFEFEDGLIKKYVNTPERMPKTATERRSD